MDLYNKRVNHMLRKEQESRENALVKPPREMIYRYIYEGQETKKSAENLQKGFWKKPW